jgi:hypothetical protein
MAAESPERCRIRGSVSRRALAADYPRIKRNPAGQMRGDIPHAPAAHCRGIRVRRGSEYCTEAARGSFDGNDELTHLSFDDFHADQTAGPHAVAALRITTALAHTRC